MMQEAISSKFYAFFIVLTFLQCPMFLLKAILLDLRIARKRAIRFLVLWKCLYALPKTASVRNEILLKELLCVSTVRFNSFVI